MTEISKDTLWKGIIEDLFEDFCAYFFPEWTTKVADFSKPPEFLDKELEAIAPEEFNQKRYADKLVKVFTKQGKEQWILIHIEVQGYEDKTFAERMFIYFYRIRDRYQQKVMSLAILTDDNANFHPQKYTYEYQDTKHTYEFPSFKILQKTEQALQIPDNPFSIVMLTAKKALDKQNLADSQQLIWKRSLIQALKDAEYSSQKIRRILHFIRFYVSFDKEANQQLLNQDIQTTFKQRQNMGIEEAILQEVREKNTLEIASNMKKIGLSTEDIIKATGLTKAQIDQLK